MASGSWDTHLAPASLSSDLGFLSLSSTPSLGKSQQRWLKAGWRLQASVGKAGVAEGQSLLYSHHTGAAEGMGWWDPLPLARNSDGHQEETPACPKPYGWRLP